LELIFGLERKSFLFASKGKPILEGPEWEAIFATCIGAE
jgi:hypothetical protein